MATGLKATGERAVGEAIAGLGPAPEGYPHRMGLLFVDAFALNGEETTLIASMLLGADVPLVGGAAGDGFRMINASWVGLGARGESDAIVVAMIHARKPIGVGVCHGHEVVSRPLRVTRSEGGVVHEVDGRPTFDVWDEETRRSPMRAGLKDIRQPGMDGFNGFIGIFELGLAAGAEYKIRAPLMKLDDGALGFACGIPEGSVIRIMQSTPEMQVSSAREAARRARLQIGAHAPAGALVIDCACRKLLLRDRFDEAIRAMGEALDGAPFAGFESYGEIALQAGDMSGFHNSTTVMLVFA
jgi:hypothetical protein